MLADDHNFDRTQYQNRSGTTGKKMESYKEKEELSPLFFKFMIWIKYISDEWEIDCKYQNNEDDIYSIHDR